MINPQAGAQAALSYANGAGNAGIVSRGTGTNGSIVMFGFPFETITTAANRAAVMDRVLDFFKNADFNASGFVDAADYLIWRKSNGMSVPRGTQGDANSDAFVDNDDYLIWREQFGTMISSTGSGAGLKIGELESIPAAAATTNSVDGFRRNCNGLAGRCLRLDRKQSRRTAQVAIVSEHFAADVETRPSQLDKGLLAVVATRNSHVSKPDVEAGSSHCDDAGSNATRLGLSIGSLKDTVGVGRADFAKTGTAL